MTYASGKLKGCGECARGDHAHHVGPSGLANPEIVLRGGSRPYIWIADNGAEPEGFVSISGPRVLARLAKAILREVELKALAEYARGDK